MGRRWCEGMFRHCTWCGTINRVGKRCSDVSDYGVLNPSDTARFLCTSIMKSVSDWNWIWWLREWVQIKYRVTRTNIFLIDSIEYYESFTLSRMPDRPTFLRQVKKSYSGKPIDSRRSQHNPRRLRRIPPPRPGSASNRRILVYWIALFFIIN